MLGFFAFMGDASTRARDTRRDEMVNVLMDARAMRDKATERAEYHRREFERALDAWRAYGCDVVERREQLAAYDSIARSGPLPGGRR